MARGWSIPDDRTRTYLHNTTCLGTTRPHLSLSHERILSVDTHLQDAHLRNLWQRWQTSNPTTKQRPTIRRRPQPKTNRYRQPTRRQATTNSPHHRRRNLWNFNRLPPSPTLLRSLQDNSHRPSLLATKTCSLNRRKPCNPDRLRE